MKGAPVTFHEALARIETEPAAATTGVRFLERSGERFLTWRQLVSAARDVAVGLEELGVGAGDRVALFFRTEPDFLVALFAAQLIGAAPVPLYPPMRLGRREDYERSTASLLAAAGVRLAVTSPRLRRLLGGTFDRRPLELGAATPEELAARARVAPGSFTGNGFPRAPLRDLEPRGSERDLALVQFSSGTTGAPKPVALSQRALLWQATLLEGLWPDEPGLRQSGVSWLPLYHDMGLIGCVLPALLRPADLTLLPPEQFVVRPARWLQAISRYRATVSPAPNFAYSMCVERIADEELAGVDLSSWRAALNGAEAVSARTLRRFAERFAPYGFHARALTPVYGLAEAALAVTFSDLEVGYRSRGFARARLAEGVAVPSSSQDAIELVSVGRPVPGFEVEVRDAKRRPLAEGSVGRVWARGPSLMDGYLGRRRESEKTLVAGWLDTGDLGFLLGGELYLTGRAKDLLVLQGRNWAPEPVEQALAPLEGFEAGAAVAISVLPEDGDQEELWVLAESDRWLRQVATKSARAESVGAPARERAELGALIEEGRRRILAETGLAASRIELLTPGALPRTSSGKLRRRRALELFLAGRLGAAWPSVELAS